MYAVGLMYFEELDEREMNLPDAPIYRLACCYREGEGTDKDEEKAIELFRRVAEHGVWYQSLAAQAIDRTP